MVVPQTPTATAAESGAASYFGRPHTTHAQLVHSMDLTHPNPTTHTGPRQAMTPGGNAGSGGFPGFAQQAQGVSESPAGWPGVSSSPFATTAPVAMTDVDRSTNATASTTSPARKHALPQSTPPNAHLVRGETASPTLSRNFDQISIRDGAAAAAVSSLHGTPPARLAGQPTQAVPITGRGSSGARHAKQQVDATALQDLLRQAMESPYGSQTSSRQTTSPTPSLGPSVMQIGPAELSKLLHEDGSGHGGSKEVLLLDLRATASFTQSRVKGAIHLGIPATLLKRSSYTIAKIAASVSDQAAHDKIIAWQEARVVILYDSESFNVGEGTPLYQLARKFTNDSWPGQAYTVKGGFAAIQKETPDLVDSRPASPEPTTHASARPGAPKLSLKQLGNFSCILPTQKSAANPFFNNIRQNQDLIGGVGQPIPLQVPEASLAVRQRLPRWLRQVAYEEGGAQRVADRFLKIEQEEQRRMQAVLGVSQDAPAAAQANTASIDARDTKHSVAAALERGEKNRYNNIWPFENARVKLQDCASDYINASHLHFRRSERHYIATQGPLPATTRDFWQLVWENDVRTVVMLTNLVEGGQAKCHAYWSDAEQMLPFALELVSEEHVESKFQGLPRHDEDERVALTMRRFELRHTERPLAGVRQVQHLQYADWPDFHVVQPAAILAILQETHLAQVRAGSPAVKRRKSISGSMLQASRAVAAERPVVAHCSAGCGRTGVFCTTDTVTALVQAQIDRAGETSMAEGAIDDESNDNAEEDEDLVEAAVRAFRDQRLSIVQTLRQFVLCYDAVLLFSLAYIRQRYGLA